MTRNGWRGAWYRLVAALGSPSGFAHVVVHNGPLWRLCGNCRAIREDRWRE